MSQNQSFQSIGARVLYFLPTSPLAVLDSVDLQFGEAALKFDFNVQPRAYALSYLSDVGAFETSSVTQRIDFLSYVSADGELQVSALGLALSYVNIAFWNRDIRETRSGAQGTLINDRFYTFGSATRLTDLPASASKTYVFKARVQTLRGPGQNGFVSSGQVTVNFATGEISGQLQDPVVATGFVGLGSFANSQISLTGNLDRSTGRGSGTFTLSGPNRLTVSGSFVQRSFGPQASEIGIALIESDVNTAILGAGVGRVQP